MKTFGSKNVMMSFSKFRSNLRLKQYLLDTRDAVIAECNVKDRYWGTRVYMSNPYLCLLTTVQERTSLVSS